MELCNIELRNCTKGHEIAVHGYYHLNLLECDKDDTFNEIYYDKHSLENAFSNKIYGMAYAYGKFNEEAMQIIENCELHYARTTNSTYDFKIPTNKLEFNPTCKFNDDKLEDLVDLFINTKSNINEPMLFTIWGHSWELDASSKDWNWFEKILIKLSNLDDVFYGSNAQVLGLDRRRENENN